MVDPVRLNSSPEKQTTSTSGTAPNPPTTTNATDPIPISCSTPAAPTRLFGVTLPPPSNLPRGSGPFGSSQRASFRAPPANPSFRRYTPSTQSTRVVKIAPRPRPRPPTNTSSATASTPMPIAPPRIRPTFPTFAPQPAKSFNPVVRVLNCANNNFTIPPRNVTAMSSQAAQSALAIHPQLQAPHQRNSNVIRTQSSSTSAPNASTQRIVSGPPPLALRPMQQISARSQGTQHRIQAQRHIVSANHLNQETSIRSSQIRARSNGTAHQVNNRISTTTQNITSAATQMNRLPTQPIRQIPVPSSNSYSTHLNQATTQNRVYTSAPQPNQRQAVLNRPISGIENVKHTHVPLPSSNNLRPAVQEQKSVQPRLSFARPQPAANRQSATVAQEASRGPAPARAELMNRLDDVARALQSLWHHPPQQQQMDTLMLHRLRALFAIDPTVSRSRVARECSVRKQSISLYLRGMFRGKQELLERKIAALIVGYFEPGAVAERAEKRQAEFAKIDRLPGKEMEVLEEKKTVEVQDTKTVIVEAGPSVKEKEVIQIAPAPNATVSPVATPPPQPLSRKAALMQSDIDYHTREGTLYANDGPVGGMRRATRRNGKTETAMAVKQEKKEVKEKIETRAVAAKRKQMVTVEKPRRSARHVHASELPPSKRPRK